MKQQSSEALEWMDMYLNKYPVPFHKRLRNRRAFFGYLIIGLVSLAFLTPLMFCVKVSPTLFGTFPLGWLPFALPWGLIGMYITTAVLIFYTEQSDLSAYYIGFGPLGLNIWALGKAWLLLAFLQRDYATPSFRSYLALYLTSCIDWVLIMLGLMLAPLPFTNSTSDGAPISRHAPEFLLGSLLYLTQITTSVFCGFNIWLVIPHISWAHLRRDFRACRYDRHFGDQPITRFALSVVIHLLPILSAPYLDVSELQRTFTLGVYALVAGTVLTGGTVMLLLSAVVVITITFLLEPRLDELIAEDEVGFVSEFLFVYMASTHILYALIRKREAVAETASKLSKAKSAFLAVMSHEMRTPLHGIIASAELLELNTASNEYLRRNITHSSEILLNLVNDLLDMSAIEAGQQLALQMFVCTFVLYVSMFRTLFW